METISGFSFFPLEFTREGRVHDPAQADALLGGLGNATDLLVMSHGWNNDMAEARTLYEGFLANARRLLDGGHPAGSGRRFVVAGVFWPSKRFTDRELIPGGGAASLGGAGTAELLERLDDLKGGFDAPDADARLDEAKTLVPQLEASRAARERYGEIMKSLAPTPEPGLETSDVDAHAELATWAGDDLIEELGKPLLDNRPAPEDDDEGEGGAAFIGFGGPGGPGGGEAAGVVAFAGGIIDGARQAANLVTYYQMKKRAGIVGTRGLAPVLERVRRGFPSLKLHLAGHSFGARLVTAAASGAAGDAGTGASSLSLLQAAFSHYGFAQNFRGRGEDGGFRAVVARIAGPVVITHTRNDKAVGIAYALASRLAGQQASALGDENDPFGGLGSNGAQDTPERVPGSMHAAPGTYSFQSGKVYNLKADPFVSGHGDVRNPAVVNAVLWAVAST